MDEYVVKLRDAVDDDEIEAIVSDIYEEAFRKGQEGHKPDKKSKGYNEKVLEKARVNQIIMDKRLIIEPDPNYVMSLGKQMIYWFTKKTGAKLVNDNKQEELILRVTSG